MAENTAAKLHALIERKREEREQAELDQIQRQKRLREDFSEPNNDESDHNRIDFESDPLAPWTAEGAREEIPESDTNDRDTRAKVDDEGEGDLELREEDEDFIDDEGVAQDERVDFADDANAVTFEEAEEAMEDGQDDLDKLFNKGRRDSVGGEAEMARQAENLMAQMEAALDADQEAFASKTPALHKLRMLKKAEDAFGIQRMHDHLMRGGILGVLKGWLEPMPDGTLPNSKIRSGVLHMLVRLNINSANEDHRDQLKKSGVGKLVMLLSKLPEETQENQRVARGLVESWSRPILGTGPSVEDAQNYREAQIQAASRRRSRPVDRDEDDKNPQRRNALIPQAAELDYTVRPKSKVDTALMSQGRGTTKVPKLLKKLNKKKTAK